MKENVNITVLFKDGTEKTIESNSDFQVWPVAIRAEYPDTSKVGGHLGSYPIWDGNSHSNLYARVMTLLEATIESPERLKAVKTLFAKELGSFTEQMNSKWMYYERHEGNVMTRPYDESGNL